jgi:hypothetical protein
LYVSSFSFFFFFVSVCFIMPIAALIFRLFALNCTLPELYLKAV